MDLVSLHFGNLLVSSREIIQQILAYLGYHDLINAIQVCEAWALVGKSILVKGRKLKYITIHPNNLRTTEQKVAVNNIPHFTLLENFIEKNLSCKSFHCLVFTCGGWLARRDIITKHSPNGTTLSELFKLECSKSSRIAYLEASGVIGSVEKCQKSQRIRHEPSSESTDNVFSGNGEHSNEESNSKVIPNVNDEFWQLSHSLNNVGYSIEMEETAFKDLEEMSGFSLILFPKQPGVKINIFKLDEKEFYQKHRPNSSKLRKTDMFQNEFDSLCGLRSEDKLKVLLLFSQHVKSFTKAFLYAAQSRQNDRLSIGGGLVDWVQQEGEYFKGTLGVTISGDNVQCASVVVPSTVRDELNLRKSIFKLKEKGLPEGHSMCFMFSCCGRGSSWYGKRKGKSTKDLDNVETRVFRSLFPHTPVIGFFGDGEIGNNFYDREDDEEETIKENDRKKRKLKQELFHQFSTIFVLVSFL